MQLIKIYKITNKISGKIYIGQTVQNLDDRFKSHVNSCCCRYMHNAILKYGKKNFSIEEIDASTSPKKAAQLENYYIIKLGTLAPNGYNLVLETIAKRLPSQIVKDKLSASLQGHKFRGNHLCLIGVRREKRKGLYETRISKSKKCYARYFKTAIEAAEAYDKLALFLYGLRARINFIDNLPTYCQTNLRKYFKEFTHRQVRSSRYKGVSFYKDGKKWRAYFYENGKQKSLGLFKTEKLAYESRRKYERTLRDESISHG